MRWRAIVLSMALGFAGLTLGSASQTGETDPRGSAPDDPRQPAGAIDEFPESDVPFRLGTDEPITPAGMLLLAMGGNEVERVRELLASGTDPNLRLTGDGLTALMIVETRAMAEVLLAAGADPRQTTDHGETALHQAVFAPEALDLLPLLVEHGADPNAVTQEPGSESPFLVARQLFFEDGEPEHAGKVLRLLAKLEADVNASDDFGYTLLHTAAVNNKPELARVALELGVDPLKRNLGGLTALEEARRLSSPEVAEILATTERVPATGDSQGAGDLDL